MTNGPYVLLQLGPDPFNTRFEDQDRRLAFTVSEVEENPNLIAKLTREAPWSQQHSEIMGPSNSFFYFGPAKAPGYLVYGNGPTQPMRYSMRQKRDGSTSRYFTAQNGKEYKWRVTPTRMECVDGRSTLALWELDQSNEPHDARLVIKHTALSIVTEILTTLTLIRMAEHLSW